LIRDTDNQLAALDVIKAGLRRDQVGNPELEA
jgi:hypothetical protein